MVLPISHPWLQRAELVAANHDPSSPDRIRGAAWPRGAEPTEGEARSGGQGRRLGPRSRIIRVANAGHPPPLHQAPDGAAGYLGGGRRVPLGVEPSPGSEATAVLDPGSTVLLYTDGLIERRGISLDEGLVTLQAV